MARIISNESNFTLCTQLHYLFSRYEDFNTRMTEAGIMGVHPSYSHVSSTTWRATHVRDACPEWVRADNGGRGKGYEEKEEGEDPLTPSLYPLTPLPWSLVRKLSSHGVGSSQLRYMLGILGAYSVLDELKPSIIQLACRSIIRCHLPFSFTISLICGLFCTFTERTRSFACQRRPTNKPDCQRR